MTDIIAQAQIAREVFEDEYAQLHAVKPKEAPRAYRLPFELLSSVHDELIRRERADAAQQRFRKVIIAGGPKHFSNKDVCDLQLATLSDLRLGCIAKGRAVLLKITAAPCKTSALQSLAEDKDGWPVSLSVYHASRRLQSLCQVGTLICEFRWPEVCAYNVLKSASDVREPWLKENRDGYFIRIDSPTDLILWPELPWSAQAAATLESTIKSAREKGGACFTKDDYYGAIHAYEGGLNKTGSDSRMSASSDVAVVRLNTAAAYLKLNMPGRALLHLEKCKEECLDVKQKQKLHFRRASALYRLRRYQDCLDAIETGEETLHTEEIVHLKQEAMSRNEEVRAGQYNWREMYETAQTGRSPEVADFKGPIDVKELVGRGYGVVTTRDVEPGELLIVANPFAAAGLSGEHCGNILGLNLSSSSLDASSQLDVISRIYDRIQDDSHTAGQLDRLYAGNSHQRLSPSDACREAVSAFPCMDAGRIEGTCTYNSFRPVCVSSGFQNFSEGTSRVEPEAIASSALYYLPSLVNHSCLGNASFVFFGTILIVRATQRIPKGQEVTFSYCDPTANLEERKKHLDRYSFRCGCPLCKEDGDDAPNASIRRKPLREATDPATASSEKIAQQITLVNKTYRQERPAPQYDLYGWYRMLSQAYAREDAGFDAIIEAEMAALSALGASIRVVGSEKVGSTQTGNRTLERDPVVAMQDAVISCIKIANDYFSVEQPVEARIWLDHAMRLHAIEFGPDIFWLRMSLFIREQGWTAVSEVGQFR